MDKTQAIDKIKKCLALGKSSNANEAAAALRQAQKLMDTHNLSEAEINAAGYANDSVDVPIQAGVKVPLQLNALLRLIKKAFGVIPVTERTVRVSDASWTIRYFGRVDRIPTAIYAHVVIFRAMEQGWKNYLASHPGWKGERGARAGFQYAFIEEISAKVEAIGFSDQEKEAIELVKEGHYGRSLAKGKTSKTSISNETASAGARAARDFSINRPMGAGDRLRLR